jgi:hypothetical protein
MEYISCNYYLTHIKFTVRTIPNRQIIFGLSLTPEKIPGYSQGRGIKMIASSRPSIQIDLNEFKLHLLIGSVRLNFTHHQRGRRMER